MNVNAVSGSNVSFKGRLLKTQALVDYVSRLNETDLWLFQRNVKKMERVNDGRLFTYEKIFSEDVWNGKNRAILRENGKIILDKITSFYTTNKEVSGKYTRNKGAEKSIFNQLFDMYNPSRAIEEKKAYDLADKRLAKKQEKLLDNFEPLKIDIGRVRKNILIEGENINTVVQNENSNWKKVYSVKGELIQEYGYSLNRVRDYENGKIVREYYCEPDYKKARLVRIIENSKLGNWRLVNEDGTIGEMRFSE